MKIMKVIMAAILCMALLIPLTATTIAEESHTHLFPASNTISTTTYYTNISTTHHEFVVYHLRYCSICGEQGRVEITSGQASHTYHYHQDIGHGPAPNTHSYIGRCICTRTTGLTYACSGNPCIYPS